MLKPEKMCRVSIVGSKSVMPQAIDALHSMKVLHIDDFSKEKEKALSKEFMLELGAPLKEAEGISASIIKVRAVSSRLPSVPKAGKGREAAGGDFRSIESRIIALSERLKEAEEESGRISAAARELEIFENLDLGLQNLADYRSLSVLAGYLNTKISKEKIRESILKISARSALYFWQHGNRLAVLVFCEPLKKEEMQDVLQKFGYSEINLANIKDRRGTAKENLNGLRMRNAELERAKGRINAGLAQISAKWFGFLHEKEKELVSESEKAEAPLRFATTKSTFIAEGWVPCSTYAAMEKQLLGATKGKVYMECRPDLGNAPVNLKNPKPIQPFEFFMNLYSLPKYAEIDPTFFIFLTFPVFFGMMLGDIGYGIITAALFMGLKKKSGSREMQALLNVMIFASFASIFFGFVFGEFFGEEALFGTEFPRLFNRVEGVSEMLLITAGIGVAQLNLGFALGFYNKLKEHGFMRALLEKGSWIILEAGVALLAASYAGYLLISPYAGWLLSIIAVLMLIKAEGIKGIVELPSLLSNVLSYTRLMAVGLASVSLALVVNGFAREFFHMGGVYILFAVMILVLGHGINLALGILGPFLQSLRLHYVEFFTKFFEGGGKPYKPFGK